MRIVTFLILLTLAAAVYVANFASNSGSPNHTGDATQATAPKGAAGGNAGTSNAPGGTPDGTPGRGESLPNAFPAELTSRSSGSANGMGALANDGDPSRISRPEAIQYEGDASAPSGTGGSADAGAERLDVRSPSGRRRPTREVKLRDPAATPGEVEIASNAADDFVGDTGPLDENNLEDVTNGMGDLASSGLNNGGGASTDGTSQSGDGSARTGAADTALGSTNRQGTTTTSSTASAKGATAAPTAPEISQGVRGRITDSSGMPLKGLRIAVVNLKNGSTAQTVTSALDGTFSAQGLESGRYALQVEPDSLPLGISVPIGAGIPRSGAEPAGYGSATAEVSGGVTSAKIVLPLSSGVQGTVLGMDGKAAKGVFVRAKSLVDGFGEVRNEATTDKSGFFFLNLTPGPYELQMLTPGDGPVEERVRRVTIEAKPGSALLLEAVDLRKKADGDSSLDVGEQALLMLPRYLPDVHDAPGAVRSAGEAPGSRRPAPTAAMVAAALAARARVSNEVAAEVMPLTETPDAGGPADLGDAVALPVAVSLPTETAKVIEPIELPSPSADLSVLPELMDPSSPDRVHLRGRVISRWGEALSALPVQVETLDGRLLDVTQTSDAGLYVFENVPMGSAVVRVAPSLKIGRSDGRGTTLLERPTALSIETFSGQKVVALEDVVVNLRRVYRLAGRIEIQDEALALFKKALRPTQRGVDSMSDDQYRSAYLRGLRLVQQNKGGADVSDLPSAADGQVIKIASDGTFLWHCTLPADDILLVLEPRTTRMSAGYGSAIGIPVTPAGVRPASLTIEYPNTGAVQGPDATSERVAGS